MRIYVTFIIDSSANTCLTNDDNNKNGRSIYFLFYFIFFSRMQHMNYSFLNYFYQIVCYLNYQVKDDSKHCPSTTYSAFESNSTASSNCTSHDNNVTTKSGTAATHEFIISSTATYNAFASELSSKSVCPLENIQKKYSKVCSGPQKKHIF